MIGVEFSGGWGGGTLAVSFDRLGNHARGDSAF